MVAFEQGDIWGGVVTYPGSTAPQQITAFVNFTNNIVNDPYASLITFSLYSSVTDQTTIFNAYEYTKRVAYPPAFNELFSIKPELTNTMRFSNLTDLTIELGAAYDVR